jgi:dihydrofolate reductase
MAKLLALTNVTLDGVMQAPGHPDEDRRDGFIHGGWAEPFGAMQTVGAAFADVDAILFGRWTYESFSDAWGAHPDTPFSAFFMGIPKYVASTTLAAPLVWANSILLSGDIAHAVRQLKDEQANTILVLGSGVLLQSLMQANLVDELVLLIHPLVLGSGRRLFPDGSACAALHLVTSTTTPTGVIVATYTAPGPTREHRG